MWCADCGCGSFCAFEFFFDPTPFPFSLSVLGFQCGSFAGEVSGSAGCNCVFGDVTAAKAVGELGPCAAHGAGDCGGADTSHEDQTEGVAND